MSQAGQRGRLYLSNHNAPTQYVLSGEPAALERSWVKETLKSIGFVVVPIQDRRQSVRCSLSMTAHAIG